MADRTTNKVLDSQERGRQGHPIANGVTIGIGALVQIESGFLNHWDETGSFMGLLIGGENVDSNGAPVGDTSLAPDPLGYVDTSGPVLRHLDSVGGTPTVRGVLVYSADSDTDSLTITDTTNPPVGWISNFRSATDLDVTLFTPEEHMAGIADGTWNV